MALTARFRDETVHQSGCTEAEWVELDEICSSDPVDAYWEVREYIHKYYRLGDEGLYDSVYRIEILDEDGLVLAGEMEVEGE